MWSTALAYTAQYVHAHVCMGLVLAVFTVYALLTHNSQPHLVDPHWALTLTATRVETHITAVIGVLREESFHSH